MLPRPDHTPDHVTQICRDEQINRLREANPALIDAMLSHEAFFRSGRINRTAISRLSGLSPLEVRRGLDEMRGGPDA